MLLAWLPLSSCGGELPLSCFLLSLQLSLLSLSSSLGLDKGCAVVKPKRTSEPPHLSRLVIGHAALKPPRNERGRKQDRKVDQGHDGIHFQRPIGVGVDQRRIIDEVRNG